MLFTVSIYCWLMNSVRWPWVSWKVCESVCLVIDWWPVQGYSSSVTGRSSGALQINEGMDNTKLCSDRSRPQQSQVLTKSTELFPPKSKCIDHSCRRVREPIFSESPDLFRFRQTMRRNYWVARIWQDLGLFQTSPFPLHPSHSARRNWTTDALGNNRSHATGPTAALIQ